MFESLQQPLYLVTVLFAVLTAFLGIIIVDALYKNRSHERLDGVLVLVFSLLAFGYGCFALGEVTWYLIFDLFNQNPALSMPDFYWVVGSIFLFIAFTIFSVHMHNRHGDTNKTVILLIFSIVLLGSIGIFLSQLNITEAGNTAGKIFLGYFYPIVSSLILIASVSVYLFYEKISALRNNLLLLLLANFAFLAGDLLYTYSSIKGSYDLIGVLSDLLYIVAYLLCVISFFSLLLKLKQPELELE